MERLQWFWLGNRHCDPQEKTDGCWTRSDTTGIDTIAEAGICTTVAGCCQASARLIAMANSWTKIKLSPLGRLGKLRIA